MSEDANLVVTLKAGTGYDSPWIVVRGDNPDDVTNKLNGLGDLISATVTAAELFKGAGNAAPLTVPQQPQVSPVQVSPQPVSNGWGGQPQQQQAPQQQGGLPQVRLHPEGLACNCGRTLEYKEVNRKSDGKQFKFWTCPAQQKRDDGHRSEFAN